MFLSKTQPSKSVSTAFMRLGRFEIRGEVGRGTCGVVYRAYDTLLARDVALKVPQNAVLGDPTAISRFLREPKAAAQLRHPHIVPVFDAGVESGRYYIASAFIDGTALTATIQERAVDFRRVAKTVLELAEALDYAHRQGVVHRDIKPTNIMLDARGDALLMDFGLARTSSSDEPTHDGAVLGTPAYMAPEQAAGNHEEVGPASDQYSLGVVLYELLCGQRPFSGPPSVVIYNVIHSSPPAPRGVRPTIPTDLETICLKAISKTPCERYVSCHELAADLRRWLDDEPIKARQLTVLEKSQRWARRNPVLASLSLAVVGLAVVSTTSAGGLLISQSQLAHAIANTKALTLRSNEQAALAQQQTHYAQEQKLLAKQGREDAARQEFTAKALLAQIEADEAARKAALVQRAEANKVVASTELAIGVADTERLFAEQERERVAAERDAAVVAATDAESWRDYCKLLIEADGKWNTNPEEALELLDKCSIELRGWEWHVLKRFCGKTTPKQTKVGDLRRLLRISVNAMQLMTDGPVAGSAIIYNRSDLARSHSIVQRNPELVKFDRTGDFAGYQDEGKLTLIDLKSGKRHVHRTNISQPLGFTRDGYFLVRQENGGENDLIAIAVLRGKTPETRDVFPGIKIVQVALSEDSLAVVAAGKGKDGTPGIFYGSPNETPAFFPLGSMITKIFARDGLAVLTLADRCMFFDYNAGRITGAGPVIPRIISISPDRKRIFTEGGNLFETRSGRWLPKLSCLPWNSAKAPRWKSVVPNESWDSVFGSVEIQTRVGIWKYELLKWSLSPEPET